MPGRCGTTSGRDSTTRTSWPASWRTTTSHEPQPRSRLRFIEAAAVLTFLSPGLRFFHQGQFEGRKKRISPHLCRAPDEVVDETLGRFYQRLLAVLRRPVVRDGQWQLLDASPAWEGNWTSDCFVAFAWQAPGGERLLVVVNYAPNQSQCYLRLPFPDLAARQWEIKDLVGDAAYDRKGDELVSSGLYLDLPAWQYHIFTLQPARAPAREVVAAG